MIQVQNLSGMRLQTATETYIQTFNATEFNRMTAAARRLPKPDGSTVIDAGFRCDYCGNQVFQAYNLFVMSVKAAGSGFPVPASAQGNGQPEETVDQMLERLENGK
ncbi:hypothetical protein AAH995_10890 [Pseudomonas putida]|uniref:hypothetical protein n=1 Tax=Pseudomonas putida TaxID=303 RepID=UPI00349EC897